VLNILERRFRGLHLRLYPAQVQGPGSVEQVVTGLRYFSREKWADVVIVCRGGGSLEDLWTFNEEPVARAIAACPVPVISAVGHETDFTIADFVADLRAPTPSAAAEMVICTKAELAEQVDGCRRRLERVLRLCLAQASGRVHQLGVDRATSALTRRVGRAAQRVDELEYRSRERVRRLLDTFRRRVQSAESRVRVRDPRLWLGEARRRLESAEARSIQAIKTRLARESRRIGPLGAAVHALSPLRILERGYAIATGPDGRVLTDAAQARTGDEIALRLAKGRLAVEVIGSEPPA
jgi:exodeoxyribonuclease VII large subunit